MATSGRFAISTTAWLTVLLAAVVLAQYRTWMMDQAHTAMGGDTPTWMGEDPLFDLLVAAPYALCAAGLLLLQVPRWTVGGRLLIAGGVVFALIWLLQGLVQL